MELKGKSALITGSTGKLGSILTLALANAGINCICHYNNNEKKARELTENIKKIGPKAIAIQADIKNEKKVASLFQQLSKFGAINILINSAAVFKSAPLADITSQKAQDVFNINITAALVTAKYFVQQLDTHDKAKTIAKIVNISDVGGIHGWANYALYCASKAALIGATKALAKELAPAVTVNSIAPGIAAWPEHASQEYKNKQLVHIPLKRIAKPNEIAAALIFLLKNDYVTGQTLSIDGGRYI